MRKRSEFSRLRQLAFSVALALVFTGCHSSSGPQLDANSNWLRLCDIDSDCVDSSQCVCGLCSETCDADAQCSRGKVAGSCIASRSGTHGHRCAQDEQLRAEPICLPDCSKDGACEPGFYCEAGACWPETTHVAPQSVSATRDLSEYDAAVSFDTPSALPDPELAIRASDGTSGVMAFLGSWVSAPDTGHLIVHAQPLQLDLRYDQDTDRVLGTLREGCPAEGCDASAVLTRSTADVVSATDAELTREALVSGLSYRVFDGLISENTFSFWISNNELWNDWCTSQVPRAVTVNGETRYACSTGATSAFPDSTLRNAPMVHGQDLLCQIGAGACACDQASCRLNAYTVATSLNLTIDNATVLRGTIKLMYNPPVSMTFTRTQGATP